MSLTLAKTDSQIKADVLNELKWDPDVDETEVGVVVKDGIVTLTGNTTSYAKKLIAREAAHRVYGVLDVVDNMTMKLSTKSELLDEDVAKAVRNALHWDALVPDDKITSTVANGVVELRGTVDLISQREHADRAVRQLVGVRGVINQIKIAAKTINTAQIKSQIEAALERQAEREAKRLKVSVTDGVVTLSGTVRSWSEKSAAGRIALFAPGVQRIDNRLIVDPYC